MCGLAGYGLPHFGALLVRPRSEEHTSELQSQSNLVCRLLLEKKNDLHGGSGPGSLYAAAARDVRIGLPSPAAAVAQLTQHNHSTDTRAENYVTLHDALTYPHA